MKSGSSRAPRLASGREPRSAVHEANAARNAAGTWRRAVRWRSVRAGLWRLLECHVAPGAAVAVVGAGNAHDVPLRHLCRRAGRVDLVDLDAAALRRARRRLIAGRRMVRMVVEDVTHGRADAITRAALDARPVPQDWPAPPAPAESYDVVLADLLFTQVLYPALADAGLPGRLTDSILRNHGQALTQAVVGWLHSSAPAGVVVHVHDLLGWWPGHPQPFSLDEVLALAEEDVDAAVALAQRGNVPSGCDPRRASLALGAQIVDTTMWRWPFSPGVDFLVCATVVRSGRFTGG